MPRDGTNNCNMNNSILKDDMQYAAACARERTQGAVRVLRQGEVYPVGGYNLRGMSR